MFRRGDGHRAHDACLFIFLDPAADMLVHERPHLRRPGFNAGAGGFAVVQGYGELGTLAVGDVEDRSFPRAERGYGGLARFVLSTRSTSGQGGRASVRASTVRTLAFPIGDFPTFVGAETLLRAAAATARVEKRAALIARELAVECSVPLLRYGGGGAP